MTTQEILNDCTIDGNHVKLPDVKLERKVYTDVKRALEKMGGKWKGGKTAAFVFAEDPTALMRRAQSGEKVNTKQEFQFFETGDKMADRLVQLLNVTKPEIEAKAWFKILEPSAGQGALIDALIRAGVLECAGTKIYAIEKMPQNVRILLQKYDPVNELHVAKINDFIELDTESEEGKFDRIIANPPFTKHQDVDHVYKMYAALRKGGRLVSLTSKSWSQQAYSHTEDPDRKTMSKPQKFLEWLGDHHATIIPMSGSHFKHAGTSIEVNIIVIDKL